jgi:hypothetical protein
MTLQFISDWIIVRDLGRTVLAVEDRRVTAFSCSTSLKRSPLIGIAEQMKATSTISPSLIDAGLQALYLRGLRVNTYYVSGQCIWHELPVDSVLHGSSTIFNLVVHRVDE